MRVNHFRAVCDRDARINVLSIATTNRFISSIYESMKLRMSFVIC